MINRSIEIVKKKMAQSPKSNNYFFQGATVEEYEEFSRVFLSDKILSVIATLMGPNWLYLGSDLSVWTNGEVQPWHRDWMTNLPICKAGIYLHEKPKIGGEFRIIPGSQHISSMYSKLLGNALAWPGPIVGKPGGMNERQYFPTNWDYSNPVGQMTTSHLSKIDEFNSETTFLPHLAIPIETGTEMIFFDNRAIHAGTVAEPPGVRAMATGLFCPNPFDESAPFQRNNLTIDRQGLADDLAYLLVIDRLFHRMNQTYHNSGLLPKLSKKHMIDMDFICAENYVVKFGTLGHGSLKRSELAGINETNYRTFLLNHLSNRYSTVHLATRGER